MLYAYDEAGHLIDKHDVSVRRRALGRAHYNYYRDLDPATGRYTESDPIGLIAGVNTYVYADANPIAVIDPRGLLGCFWGRDPPEIKIVPGSRHVSDWKLVSGQPHEVFGPMMWCRWHVLFKWLETVTTKMSMWCPQFEDRCGKLEHVGWEKTTHTYDEKTIERTNSEWVSYDTKGTKSQFGAVGCPPPNLRSPSPAQFNR